MLHVKTVWRVLGTCQMSTSDKFAAVARMIQIERDENKLPWEKFEDMCMELRRLNLQEQGR
jgi:hypothetical protein